MDWTASECEEVARELLIGSPARWSHVRLVARNLRELMRSEPSRGRLLAAAWLHDIGYAAPLIDTGMHAVDGAAFLDRAGAPSEIVSLVAFHTGAEYEAEERALVDQLMQFDRPPQEDLDVLILADLSSGPAGERVTVAERLDEITRRYESQHPVHRAIMRSRTYLEDCALRAANAFDYPMCGAPRGCRA